MVGGGRDKSAFSVSPSLAVSGVWRVDEVGYLHPSILSVRESASVYALFKDGWCSRQMLQATSEIGISHVCSPETAAQNLQILLEDEHHRKARASCGGCGVERMGDGKWHR